jgi:hypothetical protein
MNVGEQVQLSAVVFGTSEATQWSSLNQTFATVSNTGRVTALAGGTARIVASAGGKADTATVTINAASSNTVTITATAPTTIKKNADNTTESFSGSPLFVGDHEATGDKGMQGFVLFNLSNIPSAATVTSATISVSGADSNAGNPFALGPLMVENAGVPSLAEGTPSSGAGTIMSSFQNNVPVNVPDNINSARAAGATTVWLRFRMQQFVNNNGAMNYGEFTVSDMTVKY